jgi:glutamate-1-semialdehyde 2,1-aminomutase
MRAVFAERKIHATILGDGPLAQVAFTTGEVRDYRSSQHRDASLARRLMLELFSRGVFLNPMGTKLYLSLAHDHAACDEFCGVLEASLDAIA